jgi:hypothetical protein
MTLVTYKTNKYIDIIEDCEHYISSFEVVS